MTQKSIARLAAAIVSAGFIASAAWSQQDEAGEQPGQAESAPEVSGEPGSDQSPSVDVPAALKGIEAAIRDIVAAEEPEDRNRRQDQEARDLKAQEEMARWAFWMLVVSAATAAVTAAGFYLIWRTLVATRQATSVASRAWLLIKPLNAKAIIGEDGGISVYADVEVENKGPTAAMDASTNMVVVWRPDNMKDTGTPELLKSFAADFMKERVPPRGKRFVMPGEKYERTLSANVYFSKNETPSPHELVAFVCTTYRVAYEPTPRQTAIVYSIPSDYRKPPATGELDLEVWLPHDGFLT